MVSWPVGFKRLRQKERKRLLYYILFFPKVDIFTIKIHSQCLSLLLSCDAVLYRSNGHWKTNNTFTTPKFPTNTMCRHAELHLFSIALKSIHFHGINRTKYDPDIYIGGELSSVMWMSDRTVQEDSTIRRLTQRINRNEDRETFTKAESETSALRNGLTQSTWREKKRRIT